jgi:hypothetical protein
VWTDHESVLEEVHETFHEVILQDRWHAGRRAQSQQQLLQQQKDKDSPPPLPHKEEHKGNRRYVRQLAR